MTSCVTWVGVDQRKPASVYIATDSRISWDDGSRWDHGRKVFASRTTPDIFGYIGQIQYPLFAIGKIVGSLESGLIPAHVDNVSLKCAIIEQHLNTSFSVWPVSVPRKGLILYATREGDGMECQFRFWIFDLPEKSRNVRVTAFDMPTESSILEISGTGSKVIETWLARWNSSSQGGTSRAVFSAFCDSLADANGDPNSGGAPQLVGLYRIGPGRSIGIIHNEQPWFNGTRFSPDDAINAKNIEWRNRLFERCDGTSKRLDNAQHHHAPKGLGGRTKNRGG